MDQNIVKYLIGERKKVEDKYQKARLEYLECAEEYAAVLQDYKNGKCTMTTLDLCQARIIGAKSDMNKWTFIDHHLEDMIKQLQ